MAFTTARVRVALFLIVSVVVVDCLVPMRMALLDDTIPGDSICIPEESIKAYDPSGDCTSDLLGVDYVVTGEIDGKTLVKSTAGRRRSPELRPSVLANMWLRVAIQEDEDRRRQAI